MSMLFYFRGLSGAGSIKGKSRKGREEKESSGQIRMIVHPADIYWNYQVDIDNWLFGSIW